MPATVVKAPSPKLPAHEMISIVTDPTRWEILKALDEDKSAKQIAEELGMKPANCQYHLKRLKDAGLVDEFPMPNFDRRYIYQRRDLSGSISISSKGLEAQVSLH